MRSAESDDYVKELEKIEEYFHSIYSPDRDMTREEVDEMVLTIIERIFVIPVNEKSMRLDIRLRTGANGDFSYFAGHDHENCRSGQFCNMTMEA